MSLDTCARKVRDLTPGDHLCGICETQDEYRALVIPFLRRGLEENERVLVIVDANDAVAPLAYLEEEGVEAGPFLASGQLSILSSDQTYFHNGRFDPESMFTLLRVATERARELGYRALRVASEMTWALRCSSGCGRLIEYESRLTRFFLKNPCLGLCLYDARRFPPGILLDVLTNHPWVVVGTEICENFYYLPPAELPAPEGETATLQQWLRNLRVWKRQEEEDRLAAR